MKPVYSNDRKAPRMRKAKYSTNVISKELWKEFRSKFPEYKGKSDKELNNLWQDIAETIRQETIYNPLGTKLGSYSGELKYQYLPHKFKAKDEATSSEVGEEVNHINLITRGRVGKIKWERRWAVKFNKMLQFFAFEPTRELDIMAKQRTVEEPDSIRTSRNTLGGKSFWRNKT